MERNSGENYSVESSEGRKTALEMILKTINSIDWNWAPVLEILRTSGSVQVIELSKLINKIFASDLAKRLITNPDDYTTLTHEVIELTDEIGYHPEGLPDEEPTKKILKQFALIRASFLDADSQTKLAAQRYYNFAGNPVDNVIESNTANTKEVAIKLASQFLSKVKQEDLLSDEQRRNLIFLIEGLIRKELTNI